MHGYLDMYDFATWISYNNRYNLSIALLFQEYFYLIIEMGRDIRIGHVRWATPPKITQNDSLLYISVMYAWLRL